MSRSSRNPFILAVLGTLAAVAAVSCVILTDWTGLTNAASGGRGAADDAGGAVPPGGPAFAVPADVAAQDGVRVEADAVVVLKRAGLVSKGSPVEDSAGSAFQPAPPAQPAQPAQSAKGRVWRLGVEAGQTWGLLQQGSTVALPDVEDGVLLGTVRLRTEEAGWLRIGGELAGGGGTFSLHRSGDRIAGRILLPRRGVVQEIRTEPSGEVLLVERPLGARMCSKLPAAAEGAAAAASAAAPAAGGAIPQINTRPGAKGLIYINFGGDVVTDPDWNGGLPVTALPARLNASAMQEVVDRVAEDYAPFDIAISTIRSDYEKAAPGRRMRVIVTPTSTALPRELTGSGGVSWINSWSEAGTDYSATVPAWVFNSTAKTVAETVSHEVGHTLGLSHDGTLSSEYYSGSGGGVEDPTSWAPIMGMSYYRSVTQWSRGDYRSANNKEDDLAVIAALANGAGYASDPHADESVEVPSLRLLNVSGGTFRTTGVLRAPATLEGPAQSPGSSGAAEVFQFSTSGGTFAAAAAPVLDKGANVDLRLEVADESGDVLAAASSMESLGASLRKVLAGGTYQLRVRSAACEGRYPDYGSLGPYQLSGTLENAVPMPEVLSNTELNGSVGSAFSQRIVLSRGASVSAVSGELPPGLDWNLAGLSVQGTPLTAGEWKVFLKVAGSSGVVARILKIRIDEPGLPLPPVSLLAGPLKTSPDFPWLGQVVNLSSGVKGTAAASGRIANGGASRFSFSIPAKRVVSFWWRSSSEAGHDKLTAFLNGDGQAAVGVHDV
jgi:hypothetical protein